MTPIDFAAYIGFYRGQTPSDEMSSLMIFRKGAFSNPVSVRLATLVVFVLAHSLFAADPLGLLPADVAGVVVFRDLKTAADKINPFLRQINPGHAGLDLKELGQGLDLESGQWDASSPVLLILTRPEFSRESMIVAFKPAEGSGLEKDSQLRTRRLKECNGPNGEYFLAFHDGFAFSGASTKAIRSIHHRPLGQSILGALDDQEKTMLAESDAFIRIDLTRWKEKLSPFIMIGLGMMKLSITAEMHNGADTAAVIDWLLGGVRAFIDQMESTSLAFSFDRETLRLSHHHRFVAGQSVAQYLESIQPGEEDLLAILPNRPFLLVAASNWRCQKGDCLSVSLGRHVVEMESVSSNVPKETRKKLCEEMSDCYGQMRGSAFMVTSNPGQAAPLQLIGGFAVNDSAAAIRQLCYIQENADEAMSALLPNAHCSGKFEKRREQGVDYMELNFKKSDLNQEARAELYKVYGEKVRYQQAAAGPNRIVYAFAEPPTTVLDLLNLKPKDRVDEDPAIRRIIGRLPKRPHLLVLFDLERALAAVPYLAAPAGSGPDGKKTPPPLLRSDQPTHGLIGWAVVARPKSISGQWVMDAHDAVETFKLVRNMPQKLTERSGSTRGKIIVRP